jgi:endonuclease/exonuclease/phosphatase family metal-dependent hydrolase
MHGTETPTIAYSHFWHYLTRSWRHVMPHGGRWRNLDGIAQRLNPFHVVALQESDGGSLRTGFRNQTQYLAQQSNFPYWFEQINRRLGTFSRHSNGLLSRFRPHRITEHKLPGLAGRGALVAQFGDAREPLAVFVMHLALGRQSRMRQLAFLAELVNDYRHVIFMGDLNCDPASPEMRLLLQRTPLSAPALDQGTFPSWRPRRSIDHILVTPEIHIERAYVPRWIYSDHLPIAMEAIVPAFF